MAHQGDGSTPSEEPPTPELAAARERLRWLADEVTITATALENAQAEARAWRLRTMAERPNNPQWRGKVREEEVWLSTCAQELHGLAGVLRSDSVRVSNIQALVQEGGEQ